MSAKHKSEAVLPKEFQDTEIIADPLNRMISISMFEKRIICCPEFQRLRRIKQLGFAHFVYPAAEYSRFIHSLGVCHQAKKIVDTINDNLRNADRNKQWRMFGRETENEIDQDLVLINRYERVIIAAAGLLHDLPHGPFSHEIEGIIGDNSKNLIPDHDDLKANPALFLYLFDKEVSNLAVLLDHFNRLFIDSLFEEIGSSDVSGLSIDKIRQEPDLRKSIAWLRQCGVLTDTGMLKVGPKESPLHYADEKKPAEKFSLLPFLGVAIFETLLFEKQKDWLSKVETKRIFGRENSEAGLGSLVRTGWPQDAPMIRWEPLPCWFRAYRKDIIGNTICADLIDYVNRDGYHTGIVSTIDLKFLDRMTIARAVLPTIGDSGQKLVKPSANRLDYGDIPISCEHVVFDVFDHKRGFIRQSVLTEILAYLQARYLLCERVYNHRVVEASRSMLQKIISILGRIPKANGTGALLTIELLHPLKGRNLSDTLDPTGDDVFLNWVRALPYIESDTYNKNKADIENAIELATLLQERRIFREAIIYDGIHGFEHPGQLGGAEVSCRSLEAAFLTDSKIVKRLDACLAEIDSILRKDFEHKLRQRVSTGIEQMKPRVQCLVGVRKWGKRYKPPLVLVARPLNNPDTEHGSLDIEPLLDCEDPPNIKKQLDALKASYDGLWKVYLFLHPIFHDSLFQEEHENIQKCLNSFAAKNTGTVWRNAVVFEQLLSEPLDNVSYLAQEGGESLYKAHFVPSEFNRLITNLNVVIREVFPASLGDKSSAVLTEFQKTFTKPTVREKIFQQLLGAGTRSRLESIVNVSPDHFKRLMDEKEKGEIMALAARELDKRWQDLVTKTLSQARTENIGQQRIAVIQSEFGDPTQNEEPQDR